MEPLQNSEKEPFSKSSSNSPSSPFEITIISLFPEVIVPFLGSSLLGRAERQGIFKFKTIQMRDYATDKHRAVDDAPYGGGPGMLLRADVLHAAWKGACAGRARDQIHTVLLSPQGRLLNQETGQRLSSLKKPLVLVCGHYEGVDERFIELCVDEEISIGDYVLTGGELPALVLIDALARFIPGVVGDEASVSEDSLHPSQGGTLKYPQFTRPKDFQGLSVPEVLMSGNHGEIARWREDQRKARTAKKRP